MPENRNRIKEGSSPGDVCLPKTATPPGYSVPGEKYNGDTGETDGMPSADETEVIDRIMNLLTESLERSKIAILTAIHIGGKQALYVYYTQELQAFSGKVNELLGKLPSLPIQIGATGDPDWTDYKQMLKKFGINH